MTWVKLDDGFTEHPKVVQAGKLAQSLFIDGLCYSARQLTDGFIPCVVAERFGYGRQFSKAADALIDAGMWTRVGNGFQIHDYLEYQQSAASVRAERSAAKERMQRLRSSNVRANIPRSSPEVREQDPVESKSKNLETRTPPLPPRGSPVASLPAYGASSGKKKFGWVTWDEIPEAQRDELLAYSADWFTSTEVKTRVESALNHTARTKWLDTMRGLKDWLRNDHERTPKVGPRSNGNAPSPEREAERKAWVAAHL